MGLDINFWHVKNIKAYKLYNQAVAEKLKLESDYCAKYEKEIEDYNAVYDKWFKLYQNDKANTDEIPTPNYITVEDQYLFSNAERKCTRLCEIAGLKYNQSIDTMYMRKQNWMVNFVNAIHPERIKEGETEIGNYVYVPLSKSDIAELINRMEIINGAVDWDEKQSLPKKWKPSAKAVEYAKEYLPTCEGFFFGSTCYDRDYFIYIAHYLEVFKDFYENTMEDTDFLVYSANW